MVQTIEEPATVVLPPESVKIESIQGMKEFEQYEMLSVLDAGAHFQKGQYIAKAWPLDGGEWTFYTARLNVLTRAGPWAKFHVDGQEVVQSDLSIENYGKLWVFLKKKDNILAAEEAAEMEKKARADIRKEKKRQREMQAVVARASRPKREVPLRGAAQKLAKAKKRMEMEPDSSDDEQVSTIATSSGCLCGGSG